MPFDSAAAGMMVALTPMGLKTTERYHATIVGTGSGHIKLRWNSPENNGPPANLIRKKEARQTKKWWDHGANAVLLIWRPGQTNTQPHRERRPSSRKGSLLQTSGGDDFIGAALNRIQSQSIGGGNFMVKLKAVKGQPLSMQDDSPYSQRFSPGTSLLRNMMSFESKPKLITGFGGSLVRDARQATEKQRGPELGENPFL